MAALASSGCARADLTPDAGTDNTLHADASGPPDAAYGDAAPPADAPPQPMFDATPASAPDAASQPDPDAAPQPDPDAAPCTPVWTQLLDDGDFDATSPSWVAIGGTLISDTLPLTPHSGSYATRLLGFNNAATSLYQSVTVPADAVGLRASGYRCYVTSEPTANPYDLLTIAIRETGGAVLETFASLSNADAASTCGWVSFAYTAADPHAGQTIDLLFDGTSDGSYPTSFYYDSLILEALACP